MPGRQIRGKPSDGGPQRPRIAPPRLGTLEYAFPRTPDGKPDRAAIDSALPGVREGLRVLDEAYGDNGFLVANRLTLADLFLTPIVSYLGRTPEGPGLLEKAPNVRRGLATIADRPSYAKAVPPAKGGIA